MSDTKFYKVLSSDSSKIIKLLKSTNTIAQVKSNNPEFIVEELSEQAFKEEDKDWERRIYESVPIISIDKASTYITKRNNLLSKSDWTDTLSAKTRLGDTLYNQWQEYRQALRDITDQPGFPENIIWPQLPQ